MALDAKQTKGHVPFHKTNIFNLLINDINKTHVEFKYKYIVYVQAFAQGRGHVFFFFFSTKPRRQEAEGTCVSVRKWNVCIAIRKGTFIWKTQDVNLFYIHIYITHLC